MVQAKAKPMTIATGAAGVLGTAVIERLDRAGLRACGVDLNIISRCNSAHAFEGVDLGDHARLKALVEETVGKAGQDTNLVSIAGGLCLVTL